MSDLYLSFHRCQLVVCFLTVLSTSNDMKTAFDFKSCFINEGQRSQYAFGMNANGKTTLNPQV